MRLRTFHAATMKEAIARVRAEMGPDAVIIYSYERKRGRGVEVRAAAEGPPKTPAPTASPKPMPARIQGAEISLAGAAGSAGASLAGKAKKHARKPAVMNGNGAHGVSAADFARRDKSDTLKRALSFHGIPEKLALTLYELASKLDEADPAHSLAKALEAQLTFRPLPVLPPAPIMLVGGPGVGKTVTTAKLAVRARLAGHAVRVVTIDTLRSGAVEQLAKLLDLIGLTTDTAGTPAALSAWLAAQGETKKPAALFIDTPGTNVLAASEREDLTRFINAGEIEPVLVQAAGADCAEAAADAKLFAELGVRRMVMTRLDAARRLGSLLAAADASHLGIAEVSLSPYLSEPLNALKPVALARILLAQSGGMPAVRRGDSQPVKEQRVQ